MTHPLLASRPSRWLRFATSFAVLTLTATCLCSSSALAELTPAAKKQIAEVLAFKRTFSDAERKMSFNLVLLSRQSRGQLPRSLARLATTHFDAGGALAVDLHADLSPSLMTSPAMSSIVRMDGEIPQHAFSTHHVHAHVKAADLLALAANADVQSISDLDYGMPNIGSVTSQGYPTHTANKAVALGVTGSGVNVGVLSDSATAARVSALIASGDLPANTTVVPNQAGTGEDEGTAMMEIVHDLAPGANLFFATANGGQANFAANIRALRFTYHCDVIVDDFTYFAEGAFQDGTIAKAVNDVTADGAVYFSSAANSGNLTSGSSGTWEGDFKNGGDPGSLIDTPEGGPVLVHNFSSTGVQTYDQLTGLTGSGISLKWSDPLGASINDYDLFVLNATGTVVKGVSGAAQTGTQDPFEFVGVGNNCGTPTASGYCPALGDQIVIVKYSGEARAFHLDTNRGRISIATAGSTYGHNAGKSTVSMAATYWNSAHRGAVPFSSANPIETFSSDGPRKIFYNPDGSEITPGNVLFATGGGTTLQKPDVTAADGVSTATPGFEQFFGTSAAAPHAAAIAALVKSANTSLTGAQIRQILSSTAIDTMAAGVDRDSGYGILSALPAVQAARATH